MDQQPEASGTTMMSRNLQFIHGRNSVHCVFCLKPQSSTEAVLLGGFKKKPKLLTTQQFLTVVHYLTGADPTFDNVLSKEEYARSGMPMFEGNLPPMCPFCYVAMSDLIGLHESLLTLQWKIQDKVDKVRETVVQRTKVRLDERSAFTVKLHNQIEIAKVNNSLQFPSKPMPRDVSSKLNRKWRSQPLESEVTSKPKEQEDRFIPGSVLEPVIKVEVEESVKDDDLEEPVLGMDFSSTFSPEVKQEQEDSSSNEGVVVLLEAEDQEGAQEFGISNKSTSVLKPTRLRRKSKKRPEGSGKRPYVFRKEILQCGFCLKKFPDWQSLNIHKGTTHYDPDKTQKCDLCQNSILILKIKEHLTEVHGVSEYMQKCINPGCRKWFSCLARMEHHARKQKGSCGKGHEWSWSCELESCNFQTKRRVEFKHHLRWHEDSMPEKPFRCPVDPQCLERFAVKQSVGEHINRHDLSPDAIPTKQNCPVCNLELEIEPEMEHHLKSQHDVQFPIKCKRCPFLLPDKESLLEHILARHWKIKRPCCRLVKGGIPCDLCEEPGIKYKRSLTLRQHFFTVHQVGSEFPKEETVICKICKLDFSGGNSLSGHMLQVHPEAVGKGMKKKGINNHSKCDICSETFSGNGSLLTHKIKVHGAPPFSCAICSETFKSYSQFQAHKRAHAGVEIKKTFACEEPGCGKTFSFRHLLHSHQRLVHPDTSGRLVPQMPFVCGSCGKGFGNQERLQSHQEVAHSGTKSVCELCGEGFTCSASLQRHMLIHTGERPHTCQFCGQQFRTEGVMKRHLKGHEEKGPDFKPNGPMKHIRKRVKRN